MKIRLAGLTILLCFLTVFEAISEISDPISALSGEDAVARFLAEEELVDMGDAAIPILEPLVTSSGFTLERQYAVNILARISSEQAIRLLLRVLAEEPDVRMRALICRHLGRLGVEDAVPIIGKWLLIIKGKPFDPEGEPQATNTWYAWIVHVHALGDIGSEKGIPVLEKMLKTKHGGRVGKQFTIAYQQNLNELKREVAFWNAVRQIPGLEGHTKLLFQFFRHDTLAIMRLYRYKVTHLGIEGRWVLEGMKNHHDEKLRQAATALLNNYDTLQLP